jgi:two-component system, cell cycle sensor histidine kinase and response regulator CckA
MADLQTGTLPPPPPEAVEILDRLAERAPRLQGIAHDLNNMLTVIVAGLDDLRSQLGDPELLHSLGVMSQAADSAVQLAKQLTRIGRTGPPANDPVAIRTVIREAATIMYTLLPRTIRLETDVPATTSIHANAQELVQALLNLMINARDAMPDGGRLRIAAVELALDSGTFLEVLVSDTGAGMDEPTRARIFEPFFTTKAPGKGSGLGLAMVLTTVRKYLGTIDVESAPGRGTTFRILLPVAR